MKEVGPIQTEASKAAIDEEKKAFKLHLEVKKTHREEYSQKG